MPNNKNINLYQQLNEQLQDENQAKANREMKYVYKEKKKQMDYILKFVISLYATYELDEYGGLILNKLEKRNIELTIRDVLTTTTVKLGENEEKVITNILIDTANNSYYKTNFFVDIGLSYDLPMGGLKKDDINKIISKQLEGKSFSTRIWDNQIKLNAELKNEILNVINDGKDVRKATGAIRDRFNVSASRAQTLVQNEVKNTQTRIQEKIYKESNVINKVMWVATLDEKTRDKHRKLDGKSWSTHEPHPTPEIYINCRCTLAPVIKGWKPSNRYIQQTGQTIKYKKYNEWKSTK